MKKTILFLTFSFFIFVFISSETYAENITIGNASAQSHVETNIQGSGNVYTKIESEVNGEKKTLEATGSGNYDVEARSLSDSKTVESSNSSAITIFPKAKKLETQKTNPLDISPFIVSLKELMQDIFKKIINIF